jgi:hypothetical protein
MHKNLVFSIATALAILAPASFALDRAHAGGSMSAPSKYNNATNTASLYRVRHHQLAQNPHIGITEFSSSSAKSSVPKR